MKRFNMPSLVKALAGAQARDLQGLQVDGLGPVSAAAWLVFRHRRALRAQGNIDFEIPRGMAVPRYFVLAMDVLRTRPGWDVVVMHPAATSLMRRPASAFKAAGMTVYRVRWLRFRTVRSRPS